MVGAPTDSVPVGERVVHQLGEHQHETGFGRALTDITHFDTTFADFAKQDAFIDGLVHTHLLFD